MAIVLMAFSLGASAQLNIKQESAGPEVITHCSYGFGGMLIYTPEIGYLMYLRSSNRYDKKGYFRLGVQLDESVKTLYDLRELCDSIGDRILTVEAMPGRDCTIMASEKANFLRIAFAKHAGHSELCSKDIDSFIAALESRKETSKEAE